MKEMRGFGGETGGELFEKLCVVLNKKKKYKTNIENRRAWGGSTTH